MSQIIEPRVLKGFRDILPSQEISRSSLMDSLTHVFRSFGFVPIDTPVLEYSEILLGKGGGETEKQIYRFNDNGGRDVAMRFDLTVPFARFMAEHINELYLPFKRYHMAKVWRGENTQRGRYREFMQCDFDTVGTDCASSDFEIIAVIASAMKSLSVPKAKININHRGIFNRFLEKAGVLDKSTEILRIVDKLGKIGIEETKKLLVSICDDKTAEQILEFVKADDDFGETFERITKLSGGTNPDSERIMEIFKMAEASGIDNMLKLSPNITRGLDYYTGVVFETFLDEIPEIGSVCSGGRYNNLASLYTKQNLPGVGASVGLDRLIAALESLKKIETQKGYTKVVIIFSDPSMQNEYQAYASKIRENNISCEVYPEPKKLGLQYSWAEAKGANFALIKEKDKTSFTLRTLSTRNNTEYSTLTDVIKALS